MSNYLDDDQRKDFVVSQLASPVVTRKRNLPSRESRSLSPSSLLPHGWTMISPSAPFPLINSSRDVPTEGPSLRINGIAGMEDAEPLRTP